jgi:predicted Na+-dependent transporter
MSRIQALKILNPILFLLIIFQIFSGLNPMIVSYQVHQIVGILIAVGVLLHLTLNWPWIRTNILRRR